MNIDNIIKKLMQNNYKIDESNIMIKYYNVNFEIICYKNDINGSSKKKNLLIIDKRTTKHIIYNNINIANEMISI